ncbi:MAG: hypothetical protein CMH54_06920 [Myxococcales bacterium]|nr:hypothetical protein [Myxococcales bacterium]
MALENAQSTGGRLMLRLTTTCNSACAHCTIADIAHHGEKSARDALAEMKQGRETGCTELVFMRGEVTLREDFLPLVRHAREIGYEFIQVQTNGRALARGAYLRTALAAGIDFFEVSLFGHVAGLHDIIDGTPGAFREVVAGLKNLSRARCSYMLTIPVLKRNYMVLPQIVRRAANVGAPRVQFNFSRPVATPIGWNTAPLVRLEEASPWIRRAIREAEKLGLSSGTEAVPLCHLRDEEQAGSDVSENFGRHRVADVHRLETSMESHRETSRPKPEPCQQCSQVSVCPTTWAAYQELYGTAEFVPFD